MTTRKANIFTVIEAVPNWFSARQEDDLIPVATEVAIAAVTKSSIELGTPVQGFPPVTAEANNWSTTGSSTWLLGEGSEGTANWDRSWEATVTAGNTWAGQGVLQSAEVVVPGASGLVNGPGPLDMEEGLETESSAHKAFWALLKAAGYEVW